jgi:CRISPR-associated protein Cas2
MRNHYLVSYDVRDPVRLRRVHKTVRDFGDALQYSVFACQLSKKDRAILEARLLEVLKPTEDQVMFVDLGRVARPEDADDEGPPRCAFLGLQGLPEFGPRFVVI